MIAPPGSPKIVDTPSSTSDWHMALAPFKRILVLFLYTHGAQKNLASYRGEVVTAPRYHPVCVLSAVYRPPSRPGLLDRSRRNDRSPARLGGEFRICCAPVLHQSPALWSRSAIASRRSIRTTPRQRH